ncbi:hypothetical protein C5167_039856 [Papaver somniferum]|uniref:Uncharacterized protein n=1 Tax=Papaver somniferum TaxID=3469 RepID=A0A4Y7IHF7_PAPSO|nr:hypothetical protein C5167_039856 [Papaver somniferum]
MSLDFHLELSLDGFSISGTWSGMTSGTTIWTLIFIIIITRCDWDMQAQKASSRINMLSNSRGIP